MFEGQKGLRTMRQSVAPALFGLVMAGLGSLWACSSDDGPAAPASGGAGKGGNKALGGSTTGDGGDNGGTGGGAGGVPASEGGVGGNDAGTGNATSGAGGAEGGAPAIPSGGAGGMETVGPPDLVTSSNGPWPDSLTGACANAARAIACPQTGDAFFGQDGTYRINVPSYTATPTSLKDQVTGLAWQRTPEQQNKTHAEALAYCDALELGGQSDWRLPTRLEYVTVLDEGQGSGYCMPPGISIDTVGDHWTASATGTGADQFFIMNDQFGAWNLSIDSTKLRTRCVRGPTFAGSLQVDTDVVSDSMTKLVWQVTGLDQTTRTWQQALAECESSSFAGKDDWRLPNIKELATLVDEAKAEAPVIRAEFGASAAPHYWSSTPAPSFGSEGFAFGLETGAGISPSLKMTDSAAAARCVRTADP